MSQTINQRYDTRQMTCCYGTVTPFNPYKLAH